MLSEMNWLAFLGAMALVELTPGPNMGWLTALAAQQGRRVGFMAVVGITLGLAVQLVLAATGFSAFIAGNPLVYEVLRWAGIAFMLYLALEAWRETGEASPGQAKALEGFRRGFIANLLNPKALVFYIAVVTQFAGRGGEVPSAGAILILGSLHILVAILVHVCLVLAGSRLGEQIEHYRQSPWVRAGFALALIGIAAWMAVSTQR
ncbi:MAG TPA: LysE family translocator [Henriciella marina]|uniref:LysE family translocator n=1 Tax=Henriciella sp. TaxID=1968823 RepID=UPI0018453E65|nr:LysE family translocator [Henriciella sp.]HIG22296.1 LysE family translocator [Henriciella sp.]HIK64503.1 LysE family translocator [Henriciella marina]